MLAHRPFALVWGGQSVSRFGDSLYTIAVAWWVVEETGSAAALGLGLACFAVPQVVFVLLGGIAGDRFSRLRIMLVSDLVRAAAVGLVAVLTLACGGWIERMDSVLVVTEQPSPPLPPAPLSPIIPPG